MQYHNSSLLLVRMYEKNEETRTLERGLGKLNVAHPGLA